MRIRVIIATLAIAAQAEAEETPAAAVAPIVVKPRGLLHVDGRFFVGDEAQSARNTFLLRRARLSLDAALFDLIDLRVNADFGQSQVLVQDAYAEIRPVAWFKLRVGKFKSPLGLERLQSVGVIAFVERGLPTALVPSRDVGAQVGGDIAGGVITYALAVLNGNVDGATTPDIDTNRAKDVAARLIFQPFKADPHALLHGLAFGAAGSIGKHQGAAALHTTAGALTAASISALPSYRTMGQNVAFSYRASDATPDATTIADGPEERLAPQGYLYVGGFGLLAEYTLVRHAVTRGGDTTKLTNYAWQVASTYVFGGKNLFEGVQPLSPFDIKAGTWGAIEVGARYNELHIDEDTFPTYADPSRSVERIRAVGAVVTWHWHKGIKLQFNYEHSWFEGGAVTGDRKAEESLFTRVATSF